MTIGNRLNIAIVSQMLKEYKKIRMMNYITDNQAFTPPPPANIVPNPAALLNFIKPQSLHSQARLFQPQRAQRNAKDSQARGGVYFLLSESEFSKSGFQPLQRSPWDKERGETQRVSARPKLLRGVNKFVEASYFCHRHPFPKGMPVAWETHKHLNE